MGIILKIILFGVVVFGIWKTANRWYDLLGGNRRPAAPPPPPQPQAPRDDPTARKRVVEDTHACPGCGTFIPLTATKCGRPDCPQT